MGVAWADVYCVNSPPKGWMDNTIEWCRERLRPVHSSVIFILSIIVRVASGYGGTSSISFQPRNLIDNTFYGNEACEEVNVVVCPLWRKYWSIGSSHNSRRSKMGWYVLHTIRNVIRKSWVMVKDVTIGPETLARRWAKGLNGEKNVFSHILSTRVNAAKNSLIDHCSCDCFVWLPLSPRHGRNLSLAASITVLEGTNATDRIPGC